MKLSSWLAMQCQAIEGAQAGLLMRRAGSEAARDAFPLAAVWPDSKRDSQALARIANRAIAERKEVVLWSKAAGKGPASQGAEFMLGFPILVDNEPQAAVAVALAPRGAPDIAGTLRLLKLGAGWIEAWLRQSAAAAGDGTVTQARDGLDAVAAAGEHTRLRAAALAVCNHLAERFGCERVSLGMHDRRGAVRLKAISHCATFQRRTQLGDALENAMEEACDQRATLELPLRPGGPSLTSATLHSLTTQFGARVAAAVPLTSRGRVVGALVLERQRDERFTETEILSANLIGALVGPLLDAKAENERWVAGRIVRAIGDFLAKLLLGPRHLALKLATALAIVLGIWLAVAEDMHRIAAKSTLEGVVQWAAVAPFDGFIAQAPARAGDRVVQGQLLATLDDRDLRLEALRARSEVEKLKQKQQEALAKYDRAQLAVLVPQLIQAETSLKLAEDKLARTRLVAPYDGIVVSGDLSQMLGAPVERGKVLFEVAPLSAYRVVLQVEERDMRFVAIGQQGALALTSAPGERLKLRVSTIMPVASAEEGRNLFRVEAALTGEDGGLRPGLEGIAKIEIGTEKLLWVWTRSLIDWARLTAWKWLP